MGSVIYFSFKNHFQIEREIKKYISLQYCSGKDKLLSKNKRACYLCLLLSCRTIGAVNTKMTEIKLALGLSQLSPHDLVFELLSLGDPTLGDEADNLIEKMNQKGVLNV